MEEFNSNDKIVQYEESTGENSENEKNKSLITFSKLNKYYLIPFFYAIFIFIFYLFGYLIDNDKLLKNQEFIITILYDLHIVAAGLFYFISYFRTNINNKNIKNIGINYIYNKNSPYLKNKNKIKVLILLLSLMHVLDDLL